MLSFIFLIISVGECLSMLLGGKFFHSALLGSSAGLINKLIKDRLIGEKNPNLISYVWEPMQTCDAKAAGN